MSSNQMLYKTGYGLTPLSSGTTGAIALSVGGTIQNSSEYSVLQNLFTEVKLLRFKLTFTGAAQGLSAVVAGRINVGTNMVMNSTTFTTPTGFASVQNCAKKRVVATFMVRPYVYSLKIPRNLEYFNIADDCPTLVAPYGGSPGVIQIYGSDLTVSTVYFQLDVEATYMLRGRQ
jgi:hypothetical protein